MVVPRSNSLAGASERRRRLPRQEQHKHGMSPLIVVFSFDRHLLYSSPLLRSPKYG